jgi:hypothetical protein
MRLPSFASYFLNSSQSRAAKAGNKDAKGIKIKNGHIVREE